MNGRVAQVRQANIDLVEKKKLDNGNLGTKFAREELLYRVLPGRGAVWEDCVPLTIRPDGQVTLTTERPTGITDKKLLYIVEEADVRKGGRYLGEFKVTGVAEKKIALEPTRKLDKDELARLAQSKGPWRMYETMPVDKHETFEGLNKEQLAALLPASSLAEYEKDGKPAAPSDNPHRVDANKNYSRMLRDYEAIYRDYRLRQARFADPREAAQRDRKYMQEASPMPSGKSSSSRRNRTS